MDLSIRIPTPEDWQDRGAQAFDDGLTEHDHGLTDRAAIQHWKFGWNTRRIACSKRRRKQDRQQLEAACPP